MDRLKPKLKPKPNLGLKPRDAAVFVGLVALVEAVKLLGTGRGIAGALLWAVLGGAAAAAAGLLSRPAGLAAAVILPSLAFEVPPSLSLVNSGVLSGVYVGVLGVLLAARGRAAGRRVPRLGVVDRAMAGFLAVTAVGVVVGLVRRNDPTFALGDAYLLGILPVTYLVARLAPGWTCGASGVLALGYYLPLCLGEAVVMVARAPYRIASMASALVLPVALGISLMRERGRRRRPPRSEAPSRGGPRDYLGYLYDAIAGGVLMLHLTLTLTRTFWLGAAAGCGIVVAGALASRPPAPGTEPRGQARRQRPLLVGDVARVLTSYALGAFVFVYGAQLLSSGAVGRAVSPRAVVPAVIQAVEKTDQTAAEALRTRVGESLRGRTVEARAAVQAGVSSPLVGLGLGAEFDNPRRFLEPGGANAHYIHCSWAMLFLRLGVLGLASFAFVAGAVLSSGHLGPALRRSAGRPGVPTSDPLAGIVGQAVFAALLLMTTASNSMFVPGGGPVAGLAAACAVAGLRRPAPRD